MWLPLAHHQLLEQLAAHPQMCTCTTARDKDRLYVDMLLHSNVASLLINQCEKKALKAEAPETEGVFVA